MLNDVSGIKLKGGSFENLTDLNILDPRDGNKVKRVKGAIVYGRNGAGKSTVAKALKKVILGGYTDIIDANVFDKDGTIINLSEDEKKHIFVFDEEFVDANVKLQDTGLNTIVMLGQQVELADKITDAQNELHIAKQKYIDQENIIRNVFENRDNSKSPKFYQMKLKLALQGDDCWAGRDKIVRNGRSNTGVKDNTYKKFINLAPQKSRDELIILFDKKLLDLQKAENGDAVIRNIIPQISVTYNDSEVKELLSMKIEEPILSDREKYLLKLIQDGKSDMLASMISSFNDENTKHCPYCLQPVDVEYKKDLVESIQKVLSNMSCEPVTIEIEPDCINIMNFPGIDRSISEKTIAEGKSFVSRYYRNRRLGEFLKELDLSEGHSSGIPTIQEELEKNGSPRAEFFTDENRRAMRIRIPIHPAFLEEYELENDNLLQNETSFETKGF